MDWPAVLDAHRSGLARVAWRLVNSAEDAEDVLHTALLRCLEAERRGAVIRQPRSYLFQAVRRAGVDHLRARRAVHVELDSLAAALVGAAPDPALVDRMEDVRRATWQLTEGQLAALTLRYQGYPFEEIGAHLGITPGAVKALIHRGRRKLIEQVQH